MLETRAELGILTGTCNIIFSRLSLHCWLLLCMESVHKKPVETNICFVDRKRQPPMGGLISNFANKHCLQIYCLHQGFQPFQNHDPLSNLKPLIYTYQGFIHGVVGGALAPPAPSSAPLEKPLTQRMKRCDLVLAPFKNLPIPDCPRACKSCMKHCIRLVSVSNRKYQ